VIRPPPIVAIVGRPNVGKSTLFNRLLGASRAIVEDRPGVTRDRLYARADAFGAAFVLVDTGGFDPEDRDPVFTGIRTQVRIAIDEAAVVLCVLDAKSGPMPADRIAVQMLRESRKPTLFLANKADRSEQDPESAALHELGIPELLPVSAEHGRGVGTLLERIAALLGSADVAPESSDPARTRVAVVGRPNAGKSSLVNALLGEERMLVDARPGTTRDAVDSDLDRDGRAFVLVDTAGIRRRRSVEAGAEQLAVFHAIRSLETADVAVLLVDAAEDVADQDLRILRLALDRGAGLVLGLSKWDLVEGGAKKAKAILEKAGEAIRFASFVPLVPLSSKSRRGLDRIMKTVAAISDARAGRVPTARLNRFFETVLARNPPPMSGGRGVRLYYLTQASTRPPTFVVQTSAADVRDHYRRYVERSLREEFGFEGVPLRVLYRARRRRERR
jgi:GTP-binding protein